MLKITKYNRENHHLFNKCKSESAAAALQNRSRGKCFDIILLMCKSLRIETNNY